MLGGQFDRPGDIRPDAALARRAWPLVVPPAYGAARRMAMVADGVGINDRPQPEGDGLGPRRRQNLVAAGADFEGGGQGILHGIGRRQPGLEPGRRIGLARLEHIGHVLGIGVQPEILDAEIHPQQVTGLDDAGAIERALDALPGDVDAGLEPGVELQPGDPLAIPPFHILGGRPPRRDDGAGEALADNGMGGADNLGIHRHLGRGSGGEPVHGQAAGRHDARPHRLWQRRQQLIALARRQPIGKGCLARDVQRDALGRALGDDGGKALPLVRLLLWHPGRRKQPGQPIAAHRQPLDRLALAWVEEHQDGAAPGAERSGVEHGRHHWVFQIFARHQDPHVDAGLAHQARHKRLQPLAEPAVLQRGAVLQPEQRRHCRVAGLGFAQRQRRSRGRQRQCRAGQNSFHPHQFVSRLGGRRSAALASRT